jgi:hypothetical protein
MIADFDSTRRKFEVRQLGNIRRDPPRSSRMSNLAPGVCTHCYAAAALQFDQQTRNYPLITNTSATIYRHQSGKKLVMLDGLTPSLAD